MNVNRISIAKDFSPTPGIRKRNQGDFSAEEFLEEYLAPIYKKAVENGDVVEIDLDGTSGFASSFLEEVFGGLSRKFKDKSILDRIKIISHDEEYLIEEIHDYVENSFQ